MTKSKLSKRSAVFIIIAAAAILALIVLICSGGGTGLDTTEKRVEYLASLGWEVDASSETVKEIVLPETLGGVLAEYNELQKQQGFDLSQYCGEVCESYTYVLTSYPSGETGVIAQLFIYKGRVIGGDIHSAALGGFMHGLK